MTSTSVVLWVAGVLPAVVAAALGAVLASFLCVAVERLPTGGSVLGRSQCVCGRQLRAWENVPIFGWLAAGGRARCCGASIPVFYFGAEASVAAAFALAAPLALPALVAVNTAVLAALVLVGWRRTLAASVAGDPSLRPTAGGAGPTPGRSGG